MQTRPKPHPMRRAVIASLAALAMTTTGASAQAAAGDRCASTPFAVAKTNWDPNVIGHYTYYMRVNSELYRCGGYVRAIHTVYLDGRRLTPGATVVFFVGTRRSDGKWHGLPPLEITSFKNIVGQRYQQTRGVGGGLTITHVRLNHFAASGQANVTPPSSSTTHYVKWNGPEAAPRRG